MEKAEEAYGGEIKPSKPEDERFWGEPGETKYTYTAKGELIETLIGPDGKAYLEIHHTNHGFPKYHEVPHQHSIIWDQSGFHFGKEQTTKSFFVREEHEHGNMGRHKQP